MKTNDDEIIKGATPTFRLYTLLCFKLNCLCWFKAYKDMKVAPKISCNSVQSSKEETPAWAKPAGEAQVLLMIYQTVLHAALHGSHRASARGIQDKNRKTELKRLAEELFTSLKVGSVYLRVAEKKKVKKKWWRASLKPSKFTWFTKSCNASLWEHKNM